MTKFYVYVHRKLTDGQIFYVGKGCGDRAWSTEGRNGAWRKVVADNGRFVVIVAANLTEEDALLSEARSIHFYRSIGVSLTNIQLMTVVTRKPPEHDPAPPYFLTDEGVPIWMWLKYRHCKLERKMLATPEIMSQCYGKSEKFWQDVVDGYRSVGVDGWHPFNSSLRWP